MMSMKSGDKHKFIFEAVWSRSLGTAVTKGHLLSSYCLISSYCPLSGRGRKTVIIIFIFQRGKMKVQIVMA